MTTPVKKVPIHLQSAANRLLIKNGTVVNADGVANVDIYIEDCKVKQLGNHLIIPGGTRVIDATDKLVIPGGIDANVHLQRPLKGLTESVDDFYRGTRAAIVGGTTTVIDCVFPEEGETLADAYGKWRGWAEDKVCCDYGLRMALPNAAAVAQVEAMTGEDFGVNTFYMSMCGDGGNSKSFRDSAELMEAFEALKRAGALAQVHAESGEIVEREARSLLAKGVTGPEGFAMAHSEMAEEEATMRAATLASQVGCPLYVCPVMSSSAAQVLRRKRAAGAVLYGETTPAALACDGREYWNQCWRHAAGFVCAPPVRRGQADEMLALACAAPDEGLDVLASDHCTYNARQKALGACDFTKIPVGVNGVEARMNVLWERGVHAGKMDACKFVALTSATPAKIFNLYPEKGRIEVGSEADIVVWDPKATRKISAKDHQLKVDFNVFEGMECHGVAETVICQGKVMIDEGQVRVMQGFGRFLPLRPFAPFVYDAVRAREEADAAPRAVARAAGDMPTSNGGGCGDTAGMPPPTPPKSNHAVPAPSQHQSSFDLSQHPNGPDDTAEVRQSPSRASVRVRAPPGGKSSGGFW